MNSKIVLIATAILLFVVGATWLAAPSVLYSSLDIEPDGTLEYMGRRYSAYIMGLALAMWLARNAGDSPAGRALMFGGLVALGLTSLASLYGALALGLSTWAGFIVEGLVALGFAWALFFKPQPVRAQASTD